METDRSLDTMEASIGCPIVERVADDTPVEAASLATALATLHGERPGHHARFERPFAVKSPSLHRVFIDSSHERAIDREETVSRERSSFRGDSPP